MTTPSFCKYYIAINFAIRMFVHAFVVIGRYNRVNWYCTKRCKENVLLMEEALFNWETVPNCRQIAHFDIIIIIVLPVTLVWFTFVFWRTQNIPNGDCSDRYVLAKWLNQCERVGIKIGFFDPNKVSIDSTLSFLLHSRRDDLKAPLWYGLDTITSDEASY